LQKVIVNFYTSYSDIIDTNYLLRD